MINKVMQFETLGLGDFTEEAAARPIAFSAVREDSLIDLEIIKRFFPEEKISLLMVASGGCTAAQLAAEAPLQNLDLVDMNPAQLELAKLKIHLLSLPKEMRLQILGHLPMASEERKIILKGLMRTLNIKEPAFGDLELAAQYGLDFIGRYEKVFEELRLRLAPFQKELECLFLMTDPSGQTALLSPESALGKALDEAFDEIMSLDNLIKLFGEKATANRVQDFSKHFTGRLRTYLQDNLASQSPWAANLLLGSFYKDISFPWLSAKALGPMPEIRYFCSSMADRLSKSEEQSYHAIHLSNILDWLSPEEASGLLELAFRALKPGGALIIRQLNSNSEISSMAKGMIWDLKSSKQFLKQDRSFFYRNFLLGFKPAVSEAPQVKQLADEVLRKIPIIEGPFFKKLPAMAKEEFQFSQKQFFYAVDFFSRPMSALIARLPLHKDRIDILHNIVEEHGDFSIGGYHSTTFKQFLASIDVSEECLESSKALSAVNAFNIALIGVSTFGDSLAAIACIGIIEYAFSDISALIGEMVIGRKWVEKKDLVHYSLHADLDKKHAEEFFKILEPHLENAKEREAILSGLELGAYIFDRLYKDLA